MNPVFLMVNFLQQISISANVQFEAEKKQGLKRAYTATVHLFLKQNVF